MERVPKHVNINKLQEDILELEGVRSIHDLHVWSLCSNVHALSAHVIVDSMSVKDTEKITSEMNKSCKRVIESPMPLYSSSVMNAELRALVIQTEMKNRINI